MKAVYKILNKKTGITYAYRRIPYEDEKTGERRYHTKLVGKVDPATGEIVPTGKSGRNEDAEVLYRNQKCRYCFMNRRGVIGTYPYNLIADVQEVLDENAEEGEHLWIRTPLSRDQEFGLKMALEAVPERERKCALAYYQEGLSVSLVSKKFDMTGPKVESCIDRTVRRLAHPALACRILYGNTGCRQDTDRLKLEKEEKWIDAKRIRVEEEKRRLPAFGVLLHERYGSIPVENLFSRPDDNLGFDMREQDPGEQDSGEQDPDFAKTWAEACAVIREAHIKTVEKLVLRIRQEPLFVMRLPVGIPGNSRAGKNLSATGIGGAGLSGGGTAGTYVMETGAAGTGTLYGQMKTEGQAVSELRRLIYLKYGEIVEEIMGAASGSGRRPAL